ncbi:hypothetical protein N643_02425 [Salmonella bongori serovar 48:z41:-- str. RKS3044]|uniref:Uncharacterized protein n=1 Tax=Salmonella bongori serovar 44:r:- TaxID=1967585 RepID=A0A702FES5_SALBN|nr:hypothetical protein N643_02425 [Salmonella bongori serovar 48:z41:-- str. RKS3044]HAC6693769.1 hypothetical protein [Salmonella bongori serovar 44:r:-]
MSTFEKCLDGVLLFFIMSAYSLIIKGRLREVVKKPIADHAISHLTICVVITMLIAVAVNVVACEPLTSLIEGRAR